MKVSELINLLAGYDAACEATCVVDDSDREYSEENGSVEVSTASTEQVTLNLVQQQSDGTILIGARY
jgi:hypothetical protein